MPSVRNTFRRSGRDDMSAEGETIMEIRNGDRAPEGYRILRILATREELVGTGTNTRTVYVVAAAREETT